MHEQLEKLCGFLLVNRNAEAAFEVPLVHTFTDTLTSSFGVTRTDANDKDNKSFRNPLHILADWMQFQMLLRYTDAPQPDPTANRHQQADACATKPHPRGSGHAAAGPEPVDRLVDAYAGVGLFAALAPEETSPA